MGAPLPYLRPSACNLDRHSHFYGPYLPEIDFKINIWLLQRFSLLNFEKVADPSLDKPFKNPKVANVKLAWEKTNSNLVWVADSKIYTKPDTLRILVHEILESPNIGAVHCNPLFEDNSKFTSEKVYFYTQHSRSYMGTDLLNIPCLTGMSVLIRRDAIENEKFGGLKVLEKYLAEDFYMCKFLTENDYKLKLSSVSCLQNPEEPPSYRPFSERMKRWMKLRKSMIYPLIVIEPFIECLLSGIYGPFVLRFFAVNFFGFASWSLGVGIMLHYFFWFVSDCLQAFVLLDKKIDLFQLEFVMNWGVRHFIFIKNYIEVLFQRGDVKIKWCDQEYVLKNGLLVKSSSDFSEYDNVNANDSTSAAATCAKKLVPLKIKSSSYSKLIKKSSDASNDEDQKSLLSRKYTEKRHSSCPNRFPVSSGVNNLHQHHYNLPPRNSPPIYINPSFEDTCADISDSGISFSGMTGSIARQTSSKMSKTLTLNKTDQITSLQDCHDCKQEEKLIQLKDFRHENLEKKNYFKSKGHRRYKSTDLDFKSSY